eukprot:1157738-Pelagomonas_calceolata.AAC.2
MTAHADTCAFEHKRNELAAIGRNFTHSEQLIFPGPLCCEVQVGEIMQAGQTSAQPLLGGWSKSMDLDAGTMTKEG